MTIDEVMALVKGVEGTAIDIAKGWTPGEWLEKEESDLRAALLALVAQARDEEAEDCALVCEDFDACSPQYIARSIRARIAARKGGNHD